LVKKTVLFIARRQSNTACMSRLFMLLTLQRHERRSQILGVTFCLCLHDRLYLFTVYYVYVSYKYIFVST